jgi:hypothetical protein
MTSRRRGEIAFVIAVGTGLIVGKLIKKMSVGIMIGVLLGLMFLMAFSSRKKNRND